MPHFSRYLTNYNSSQLITTDITITTRLTTHFCAQHLYSENLKLRRVRVKVHGESAKR